jgi:monovalent cation:H+ antiporter-2, CPA2 family
VHNGTVMHGIQFLQDLAVVLLIAGATTVLFHRIKQPVVLGYLLAGFIIGPHTPPFSLVHEEGIKTMAELGVVMLMFGLGLHFSLRQLFKVGAAALIAAVLEIAVMIWIGYGIGQAFGWSQMDSVFLGALLSISSTTIIVKALEELRLVNEGFAKVVFGILIVEDILAIALIALLSGVAKSGQVAVGEVAITLGMLSLFLVGVLIIGLLVVPKIIGYVARFRSDEVLLVSVLGLCFGVSLLAVLADYSVALGAFLIGAVMAEVKEAPKIRLLVEPVRDMFSAMFFVAIGMMIDLGLLLEYALPIAVITVAVVVGKIAACSLGTFLAGTPVKGSLKVGSSLAQIGEFSFIIAQLGLTLKVTSDFLYPVAVSVSALTTLLTPYLIRSSDRLASGLVDHVPAPLHSAMDWYTRWVENLRLPGDDAQRTRIRGLIRKWLMQIAIDLALITGGMVLAWRLAKADILAPEWLPEWSGGLPTVWWMAVMIIALPLLVHLWYKQRALAMVLAELAIPRGSSARADRLRVIATLAFQAIAIGAVAVLLTAISLTLLPPWPVLLALLGVLALILLIGWSRFVTLYYRAQVSVMETFAGNPEDATHHAPAPALLDEAVMLPIELPPGVPAVGKAIRELEIRKACGASIIAIERSGARIVNPPADEVLVADDIVTLFGTEDQVRQGRALILG